MAITPGTRLGVYEILTPLGAGGMGEVYQARDTRLDRVVAIKVLRALDTEDPARRARFEREARLISHLNHPHICTLFDVGHQGGVDYLVMELLDGQTLGERLKKGALPLDQALQVAVQIAGALDAAHRQGIVHRDLKPANVMLTKSGAKLLDFGIARLAAPAAGDATVALTQATLTMDGAILGTLQYMSPEQIEGRDADARSDVFAFGDVLYEMLTGQRAFTGETRSSVIAAVLEREPVPVSTLRPEAPAGLVRLVQKCLAKDPDARWQSVRDLRDELQWIAVGRTDAAAPAAASRISQKLAWTVAALSVAAAIVVGAAAYLRRPAADTRVYRSTFAPPAGLVGRVTLALSPDGRNLALAAADTGRTLLWVRALDGLSAAPLAGTEGAVEPFWSPDSRSIAFVADGKLQKIDASGGPAAGLAEHSAVMSGAWRRDGTVLFLSNASEGLSMIRVSAPGESPAPVTTKNAAAGELWHGFPSFLPDGRHFLFSAVVEPQSGAVYVGSLDAKDRTRVLEGLTNAQYSMGYLFFMRDSTLMAQPFDAGRLRLTGDATPVAEHVRTWSLGTPLGVFTVSNALLAFQHEADSSGRSRLAWFDRSGNQTGVLGARDSYGGVVTNGSAEVSLSADGGRATVVTPPGHPDVWIFDVARGTRTRLTFDPKGASAPVWSPDGNFVAFRSVRNGHQDLYRRASNGAGADELLFADRFNKIPESWSPDGRYILFAAPGVAPNAQDSWWTWALPLVGDRKPFPFMQSHFTSNRVQFSPDGRWVAYQSNESGRFEVYVTPFPGAGGKTQISVAGGREPRWRGDGKELFYLEGRTLMAAEIKSDGARAEAGAVHRLFQSQVVGANEVYDVARDGQHFLMDIDDHDPANDAITVVVNWPALLKQ
jgi:eukaryotic-like serine/threonine-protein kinase